MTALLAGVPKSPGYPFRHMTLDDIRDFINPFHIGQSLTVVWGNPQTFTVAAITHNRCAMRHPVLRNQVRWYTVADLLRWNPQRETEPEPLKLLPPAIAPGLHYRRGWRAAPVTPIAPVERTIVRVIGSRVFYRDHTNTWEPGCILNAPREVIARDLAAGDVTISYEPVTLDAADEQVIAEQYMCHLQGVNWGMVRFNRALDAVTPAQWEQYQTGRSLRVAEQALARAERRAS